MLGNVDAGFRLLPVKITDATPATFTVTFPDGSSHRCLSVPGLTYSTSSGKYAAIHQEGSIPLVIPVQ